MTLVTKICRAASTPVICVLYMSALYVGFYLLRREDAKKLSRFRDKSALFGRELAPGEPPSWR
ncbi:NADH dehydrogenase [ubiquinone] 1 beta subcomplex subunit 1 [Nomia melanderi]|uniref:NADH dehydrogenase [ubiquinone] 1 beta subcomplex subunit 1 n=1 Tax=Nomia melanderi TaxID=2448451 RepID=UPI003FCEC6E4